MNCIYNGVTSVSVWKFRVMSIWPFRAEIGRGKKELEKANQGQKKKRAENKTPKRI